MEIVHCVKSQSFSGPYFPVFGWVRRYTEYSVRMRENTDQKNSEYRNFSHSGGLIKALGTPI